MATAHLHAFALCAGIFLRRGELLAQTLRLFFGNGALHRLDGGAQLLRCGQKVLGILADLARKFFQFDSTFRHYFPPCAAYPA